MRLKYSLFILGLLLILIPYFINIYSIYRLISVLLGIFLIFLYFIIIKNKRNLLYFSIPFLLLIITYGGDFLITYILNTKPIYAIENKSNAKVITYDSLFYRLFWCDNSFIFDYNYQKSFACNSKYLLELDINQLLNNPKETFKKYHNKFIKVKGKISKIDGSSTLELKAYKNVDNSINGYVDFNDESKLVVNVKSDILNKYKIYDYITVIGLVKNYDSNNITLKDTIVVEENLYNDYKIEVIEKDKCSKDKIEYMENFYTYCLNNIYLDYGFDKYELSYAIKDGKISLDDILSESQITENYQDKLYILDKFNILSCHNGINYLLSKDEKINNNLCEN